MATSAGAAVCVAGLQRTFPYSPNVHYALAGVLGPDLVRAMRGQPTSVVGTLYERPLALVSPNVMYTIGCAAGYGVIGGMVTAKLLGKY